MITILMFQKNHEEAVERKYLESFQFCRNGTYKEID